MTILLKNILSALEQSLIDSEQALYLIYNERAIDYPITSKKLLELTKLKYIVSGRVGKILMEEENTKLALKGTIVPIYNSEISKKITPLLFKYLGVVDPETNKLRFPGGEDSVQHTADNYLGGEGLIAYHFLIFLYMFPSSDNFKNKYNRKWEHHFFDNFSYSGPRLRVRSKSTATAFKKIVKTKDMGIFLYGTYLYIKSCIRENKAYIKSITNYTKEYHEWYDEAEEVIKKAKDVESLFKTTTVKEGRLNVGL